jgi:hypothetical protein
MTEMNCTTLKHTRQQLQAKADELQSLQEILFTGDSSVIDRHKLIIEQIRELKESYQKLTTELPDGRRLLPQQYETLKTFARRNELKVQDLLKRITIEGGVITHGDFTNMNLTTLTGLGPLSTLRRLDVSNNYGLHSLRGIPTQGLEELQANSCYLENLANLYRATKLRVLGVGGNPLSILTGIPTQALEEIDAWGCELTVDLSELRNVTNLKRLNISRNSGLVSLKGIPTQALEELDASHCGITRDLWPLNPAFKMRLLNVSSNKGLTSLRGIPILSIEEIHADNCGLTGDQTYLSQAPNLRRLVLHDNAKSLTLDKTKFSRTVNFEL